MSISAKRAFACRCALAIALVLAPLHAARAGGAADFYSGRTLSVLVGHSAGGGYDLYARMLARFLGRHIPGQPIVVVQNMPGAGGLRAANYLYSVAPKDGSVVATFSRSIPILPLLAPPASFDATKLSWLGSMSGDTSLCLTSGRSGIRAWQDMMTKPVVMGGQSSGADSDIYARLYRNVLGAQIKLVSGYPGTNDITLAMERGEVDGICGLSWGTIKVAHPDWLRDGSVNFLLQAALKKDAELAHVPFALDLVDDLEKKQILYLHFAPQAMGRPFAAPPGIPAERKAALAQAFDDTMRDPELVADAAREKMEIDAMPGRDIDALLARLYATPAAVIAKAAKVIAD